MEGNPIAGSQHAAYRLKLMRGFLEEDRQDAGLSRWRSAVDGAQLAVENAGKTALALFGRVGRTHNPATQVRRLIGEGQLDATLSERLERLAELAELLGPDIHVQMDYGDEIGGRTPRELFEEEDARQALTIAGEAASLADRRPGDLAVNGSGTNARALILLASRPETVEIAVRKMQPKTLGVIVSQEILEAVV